MVDLKFGIKFFRFFYEYRLLRVTRVLLLSCYLGASKCESARVSNLLSAVCCSVSVDRPVVCVFLQFRSLAVVCKCQK